MSDAFSLVFGLLLGLTSPTVESSLVDLDSNYFQARHRATTHLCEKGSPYVVRILAAASANGVTLERRYRLERIADHLTTKVSADSYNWYARGWQSEGDVAEFLLAPGGKLNWPEMHSLFWLAGIEQHTQEGTSVLTPAFKRYFTADKYESDLINARWYFYLPGVQEPPDGFRWTSASRTSTKLLMVDALRAGRSVDELRIVLACMRAAMRRKELHGLLYTPTSIKWQYVYRGNLVHVP